MSKKYIIERSEGCCLPDKTQNLLLRASLGTGNDVIDSYQNWRALIDFEDLDSGSYRLLPLLYSTLNNSGINDELYDKIKGVYRLHWAKNNLLFNAAAPLLRKLQENNVSTMVLKGAVLATSYYGNVGLRPMDDVDILVPRDQALMAQDVLMDAGLKPDYSLTRFHQAIDANYMLVNNSYGFHDQQNMQIDLHWEILPDCIGTDISDAVWQRAEPYEFQGVRALQLNLTDQLFQILVHGIKWNSVPSFRWIVDALFLLRTEHEKIEWSRLFELARDCNVSLLVREACDYLVSEFGADIPLERVSVGLIGSPTRQQVRALAVRLKSRTGFTGQVASLWQSHRNLRRDENVLENFLSWPIFFKNLWGVNHVLEVPLIGIKKMSRWKHSKDTKA